MQCHANVLDTTGTTCACQQLRYIEKEQKTKDKQKEMIRSMESRNTWKYRQFPEY